MTPQLSIYLDFCRVLAALFVVIAHMENWGLATWLPSGMHGRDAVVIFFVLSGMVITHSAQNRTLTRYTIDRVARIYSVSIPILFFTIIIDLLFMNRAPFYYPLYQYEKIWAYAPFFLSFLGDSWSLSEPAFSNIPWWSLNYEVWYYILFGCLFYLTGYIRVVFALVALLIMGPKLLLLGPIWFAGSIMYNRISSTKISPRIAQLMFFGSIAIYISLEYFNVDRILWRIANAPFGGFENSPLSTAKRFPSDWVTAGLFLVNIVGWYWSGWTVPYSVGLWIKYVASFTFVLYLSHVPILQALRSIDVIRTDSFIHSLTVFFFILIAAKILAFVTENRRKTWSNAVQLVWYFLVYLSKTIGKRSLAKRRSNQFDSLR